MSAYLVRVTDTKELVGLFVCGRLADLGWLVDECCDPGGCEYRRHTFGSIYWPEQGKPVFGDYDRETDLSGVALSDSTLQDLDDEKARWKPVI